MSKFLQNQRAWDALAESNSQFATPATDEECAHPLLTLDTRGWLPGSVKDLKVLCLAAGGGWQSILYAVAGADVTVVDLSELMLTRDREEANRRNVQVQTIQASMDDLSMLATACFDIVHQPVSTCYIDRLEPLYREVARVIKPGGLYISQHKQPASLQIVERDSHDRYVIGISYYHRDPLPEVVDRSYRERGTVEYLHTWQSLVGELCKAGFVIEDLVEPRRGDPQAKPGHFRHRGMFIPPYVRLKARRIETRQELNAPRIWVPENGPVND